MKKILAAFTISISGFTFSQGQALGEIIGTIVESNGTSAGIPEMQVWVEDQGRKYQVLSDLDGKFRISGIPSGTYFVNFTDNVDTVQSKDVYVPMDGFGNLGKVVFKKAIEIDVVTVGGKEKKIYDDLKLEINSSPVSVFKAEDIKRMPNKFDVKSMVSIVAPGVSQDSDGELMFRGSRKGDMLYYIDGVKVSEVQNIPSCAINSLMVYTGGVPAKYGDTTGGVIVLESKSYFDLLREYNIQQRSK